MSTINASTNKKPTAIVGHDSHHMKRFDGVPGLGGNLTIPAQKSKPDGTPSAKDTAVDFLRSLFAAGRPVTVTDVELKARDAGLLGTESISQSKPFRAARKALGIKPYQKGRQWLWALPKSIQMPSNGLDGSGSASDAATVKPDIDRARERSPFDKPLGVVAYWASGVARLDSNRPPIDVPRVRWYRFIDDCTNFLDLRGENWATRAAALGWDAISLFGCDRNRPLMHLGQAGLLWLLNGDKLLSLGRDWAMIEAAATRAQRVFNRRVNPAHVVVAWELRR
jgi:hypothetical protein